MGCFRAHKIKAQKFREKFRSIFREKIRASKKIFRANFVLQTCHPNRFRFPNSKRYLRPDPPLRALDSVDAPPQLLETGIGGENIRSHLGKPNQRKGQFMNFSRGHSGTKVRCESRLFSQGKTPEFTKMGEIHELFVLALSLVWFAGATPESNFRKLDSTRGGGEILNIQGTRD